MLFVFRYHEVARYYISILRGVKIQAGLIEDKRWNKHVLLSGRRRTSSEFGNARKNILPQRKHKGTSSLLKGTKILYFHVLIISRTTPGSLREASLEKR